jgi:hypothetical protein
VTYHRSTTMRRAVPLIAAMALAAPITAGCGDDEKAGSSDATEVAASGSKQVFPVKDNPISTKGTASGLTITKALVENNVDPVTGEDVADHLEVAFKNTTAKPLDGVEVYYKIRDETDAKSEGYYAKLDGFVVKPGRTRVAHFDGAAGKDHFPVNKYSLYYTDENELFVDVMAGAPGLKPTTFTVRKDAANAEAGVEQD